MAFPGIILLLTALCNALMAGIFFAFSISVMPGFAKLNDLSFIQSMQMINRAIQNPVFFFVFFGILLLLPLSTFLYYQKPPSTRFWLLLAATIIYFVCVWGNCWRKYSAQ
jgi:uncharacterized membrane protein